MIEIKLLDKLMICMKFITWMKMDHQIDNNDMK